MTKDSSNSMQINDNLIPEFKVDTNKINILIESEARLKSYHALFSKYLQTIMNEPSPTKKRYYGRYLEEIIEDIQKDKKTQNAPVSRDGLLAKIISFVGILAGPQNISLISDKAQTIVESGQIHGFHESITQEIYQQIGKYIKTDLTSWVENKKDPQLSLQLKEQEEKLNINPESEIITTNYTMNGQKFWEECLNLSEKFFLPKSLEFNFNEESKKYLNQINKEKDPFISGILNSVKMGLNNNALGSVLSEQIQHNICRFDPDARMAEIGQMIVKLTKKLVSYLSSKINI